MMLPLQLHDGADDNNILGIDVDSPRDCLLLTERGVYVNIIKCGYCSGSRTHIYVEDVDDFLKKNKGLFSAMANSRQTFNCTFTPKPRRFAIHMRGNLDRKSQGDIFFEFHSLNPTPYHKAQAKIIIQAAFDGLSSSVATALDLTGHRIPDEYLPPVPMYISTRCGNKLTDDELLKRADKIRENDRARKREYKLKRTRNKEDGLRNFEDTLDPDELEALNGLREFKGGFAAAGALSSFGEGRSSSMGGGRSAAAAAVSSFSSGAPSSYVAHAGAKGYSFSGAPSSYGGAGAVGYSSYGGASFSSFDGRSSSIGGGGAMAYPSFSGSAPSIIGGVAMGPSSSLSRRQPYDEMAAGSSSFGRGSAEMTNRRANQLYEKQQQAAARQQAATVGDSHDDRDLPIVPRNHYHYPNPYSPNSDDLYIRESSGDGV